MKNWRELVRRGWGGALIFGVKVIRPERTALGVAAFGVGMANGLCGPLGYLWFGIAKERLQRFHSFIRAVGFSAGFVASVGRTTVRLIRANSCRKLVWPGSGTLRYSPKTS